MTPAERARQIDQQEFAAECKAARERALAYAKQYRMLERQKVKAWLRKGQPAPINLAAMKIACQPVQHEVNGISRTIDEWATHLGISTQALLVRRRKLGSLEAAIAKGIGSQRGRHAKPIKVDGVSRTIKEWAEHLGIKEDTLRHRIGAGRTPHEAVALGGPRGRPGVVSNLPAIEGTGAGSTAQESPNITFSESAA